MNAITIKLPNFYKVGENGFSITYKDADGDAATRYQMKTSASSSKVSHYFRAPSIGGLNDPNLQTRQLH